MLHNGTYIATRYFYLRFRLIDGSIRGRWICMHVCFMNVRGDDGGGGGGARIVVDCMALTVWCRFVRTTMASDTWLCTMHYFGTAAKYNWTTWTYEKKKKNEKKVDRATKSSSDEFHSSCCNCGRTVGIRVPILLTVPYVRAYRYRYRHIRLPWYDQKVSAQTSSAHCSVIDCARWVLLLALCIN